MANQMQTAPELILSLLTSAIGVNGIPPIPQNTTNATLYALSAPSKGRLVLNPIKVTTDFDLLRFGAAALYQLHIEDAKSDSSNADAVIDLSTLLISSPYNNPGHYLDLKDLDIPNVLLAKALTVLKPTRLDYATAPYTESLNLNVVLEHLRKFAADEHFQWKEKSFYVVIFRSQLMENIDIDLLYELDYESHREAAESGGLLKYWFGATNSDRKNLATCFWRSQEDAHNGGLGPWHKKARAAARELYESIDFSVHRFTVLDDAVDFKFEEWA